MVLAINIEGSFSLLISGCIPPVQADIPSLKVAIARMCSSGNFIAQFMVLIDKCVAPKAFHSSTSRNISPDGKSL